ncbi:class II D-tagatose-bisphosphate aldolase, non-catalytic subunit [Rhodobacteraceae bacterium]|nr:class II D-tagatose-bisphosphate aldolase, non-catalytic subunit [Paracoccaceae bacterium]
MNAICNMIDRNRKGEPVGLPSFCTANAHVLQAIMSHAAATGKLTVIEATCNQVNQEGGYTGMTPRDYMGWVRGMAADAGVPMTQLVLGGDHLGPNPWKSRPAEEAMEKARELVRLYVEAGFTKIHLDASMPLGGEAPPSFETIAARAADLCVVAETHAPDPTALVYIVGTEVPIPGGETEEPDALDVTSVDRLQRTIDTHRAAWTERGLDAAWERIVSVVTQPGVDFGHSSVFVYDPEAAANLSESILASTGLTFEAHSTDYQPTASLAELVRSHFFFLKVGPELTFRFREAVWALADIEAHLDPATPSRLREVVAQAMEDNPAHWSDYYRGTDLLQRIFSYSDRIRYYWAMPEVAKAVGQLIENLTQLDVPPTLVTQAFSGLEFGQVNTDPVALIDRHIGKCIKRYYSACSI